MTNHLVSPRLLLVLPSLETGGAEMQSVQLANALARKGAKVMLVSLGAARTLEPRLGAEIDRVFMPRTSKLSRSVVLSLAECIDHFKPTAVLANLLLAIEYVWLAKLVSSHKCRFFAGIHTTRNRSLKYEILERLVLRPILQGFDGVIFVCHAQRAHWLEKYPKLAPRAHVIHNGIDSDKFKPPASESRARLRTDFGIPEQGPIVVQVAAFRPEKGHEITLEAFQKVIKEVPDAHLVLAGDGDLRPVLEAKRAELGLTERVYFLGRVSDVRELVSAASVSVISSTAVETFSMAMLESLSLETPMVATDIGGTHEAVIHEQTGLLLQPGSSSALAQAILRLVRDPETAKAMGMAGRQRVVSLFSEAGMVDRYWELLFEH